MSPLRWAALGHAGSGAAGEAQVGDGLGPGPAAEAGLQQGFRPGGLVGSSAKGPGLLLWPVVLPSHSLVLPQ